jgi:hypothetical protein
LAWYQIEKGSLRKGWAFFMGVILSTANKGEELKCCDRDGMYNLPYNSYQAL